jgi:hypothetical protein
MHTNTLKQQLLAFLVLALMMISCEKQDKNDIPQTITKEKLSGFVQKGPFLNGTSISIAELNELFGQTGKNFTTQTSDNTGSFTVRGIELSSQYVELMADGFYFNEVSNEASSARLVLYALSDITDKSTLNVNLMSHMEKDRIYSLLDDGTEFSDAKAQAQQEVLAMFGIEKADMAASELLDIAGEGDDHAILLAISVLLQGHRTVAEMSELLANMITDFRTDGELHTESYGSELINHALRLDLPAIRQHLEDRYAQQGMDITLPPFEKYIRHFIEHSGYPVTEWISYPDWSPYGRNVLYEGRDTVVARDGYSLAAELPEGSSLTVKMSGGLWYYRVSPEGPVNWTVSAYDHEEQSQTFTATEPGSLSDLAIEFAGPTPAMGDSIPATGEDPILVEFFENGSESPSHTKYLYIKGS